MCIRDRAEAELSWLLRVDYNGPRHHDSRLGFNVSDSAETTATLFTQWSTRHYSSFNDLMLDWVKMAPAEQSRALKLDVAFSGACDFCGLRGYWTI